MVIQIHAGCRKSRSQAYALLIALLFTGITLLVLVSSLNWTSSQAVLDERKQRYFRSGAAAEAAAAKVAGTIVRDFQQSGPEMVFLSFEKYRSTLPGRESTIAKDFVFSDNRGQMNRVDVRYAQTWGSGPILAFPGTMNGQRARFGIEVQARERSVEKFASAAAVHQEVEIASIPLLNFGVFYDLDLEVNAPETMTITGCVHGNGNIYCQPDGLLTFNGSVTSSGRIATSKDPNDPVYRSRSRVVFQQGRFERMPSLSVASDAKTDKRGLHRILEQPTSSELSSSPLARKSFYNTADLIILFTDNGIVSFSGSYDKFGTTVSKQNITRFTDDKYSIYDWREGRYAYITEIDLNDLRNRQAALKSILGRNVYSLYVADLRSVPNNAFSAFRLVNGNSIDQPGFTLATPNPLYIEGDFNSYQPAPVCLAADSITVLSSAWRDNRSTYGLYYRRAISTKINASLITGTVPTARGYYSGGLENVIRLLEDWGGDDLTFTGSIAVLFPSQTARGPWGASPYVYNTPNRYWTIGPSIDTLGGMPPGVPDVMIVNPGKPRMISAKAP